VKIIRIDMEPLHHHIDMAYKCETRNLVSAYHICVYKPLKYKTQTSLISLILRRH